MRQRRQVYRRVDHLAMSAIIDPAFKVIPRGSTAFIIWRIENMQVVALPKESYGKFYNGDSYIIYAASEYGKPTGTDVKVTPVNGTLEVHIHFWLGTETSTDEAGVAAFKTVELDDYLGGSPIQHREVQGNESNKFKSYFKSGFKVLSGGVASGLNQVTDTFEPRLFRVKGRRSPVVTQLPSITWDHFNSGDVFILDTKDIVFVWVGKTANNMEKLQAAQAAVKIRDEHNASSVVFVDDGHEQKLPTCEKGVFNNHLNLKERVVKTEEEAGCDQEAEVQTRGALTLYHCSDEDGTYKVTEVKSGPLYQTDLSSEDSFIVDNGVNGIWVWVGRKASSKERVEAMRNAHGFVTKKGYPNNTAVTRVVDGGEPVEFKVLFSNWKEKNQTTTLQNKTNTGRIAMTVHTKFDAATLHEKPQLAAESQLVDDGSGEVNVWRVENFELVEFPQKLYGVFFSGDSYVVQYKYFAGGAERVLLYYWLGQHSPADERGTAALKTIELDDAIGGVATQIRVVQGKEPAHFLTIFSGRMIILRGGRGSSFEGSSGQDSEIPDSFLLQVQGNHAHNTRAIQVDLRAGALNSNDSFVLKTVESGNYVWFGKGSTGDEREMAKRIASIATRDDYEVVYEGQEKQDFWNAIGGQEEYANDKKLAEESDALPARLFHCSNASGNFKAEEIPSFTQGDLIQEDVMLLDCRDSIFLWVGQFSNKDEKDAAIQLVFEYLRTDPAERDEDTPIILIKQGYEPPTFTGFFGAWDPEFWKDYQSYDSLRRELEGKNPILITKPGVTNKDYDFDDYAKYPIEVLRDTPENLPDDVDKTKKEVSTTENSHDNTLAKLLEATKKDTIILQRYRSCQSLNESEEFYTIVKNPQTSEDEISETRLYVESAEEDLEKKEEETVCSRKSKLRNSSISSRSQKAMFKREKKLLNKRRRNAKLESEIYELQKTVLELEKKASEAKLEYYTLKLERLKIKQEQEDSYV